MNQWDSLRGIWYENLLLGGHFCIHYYQSQIASMRLTINFEVMSDE